MRIVSTIISNERSKAFVMQHTAVKSIPSISPPEERFRFPLRVSPVLVAFPAKVDHLIPAMAEIPREFFNSSNIFARMANEYFYSGTPGKSAEGSVLKEGVEPSMIRNHMHCVRNCYALQQDHKLASLAFLFSCWIELPKSKR